MEEGIQQAVRCIKAGNHVGFEEAMRALRRGCDADGVFDILRTDPGVLDAAYIHFVGFKLLSYHLICHPALRFTRKEEVHRFLMDYADSLLVKQINHPTWRPVVSEFAASFAIFLKLSCVAPPKTVSEGELRDVVQGLVVLTSTAHSSPAFLYLCRVLVQRAVEEFGLFDPISRCRGLPMEPNRRLRGLFNTEGFLPLLAKTTLLGMLRSPYESDLSAEAGLRCLISCFSWPLHAFFEEESPSDESCELFEVTHPIWEELLLVAGFPNADLPGPHATLFDLLRMWFDQGTLRGAPVRRRHLAEISHLLCSFKNPRWGQSESVQFVRPCFHLCINMLEKIIATNDLEEFHLLSPLTNGLYRLVTNYTALFLQPCFQDELMKLAEMTRFFVSWDASNLDEDVMSSLDEAMSAWVGLVTFVERDFSVKMEGTSLPLLQTCCHSIFSDFLSTRTSACVVDEDENGVSEALTNSHLDRIARIARGSPSECCAAIITILQRLMDSSSSLSAQGVSAGMNSTLVERISEGIWIVLKVIGFFVADSAEGEQPCIPRCFANLALNDDRSLERLMEYFFSFYSLLSTLQIRSVAVISAYSEIIHRYLRTYVECEDCVLLYAEAFNGGARVVDFALKFSDACIQGFPYDLGVMRSVGDILDSIADKSPSVLAYVRSLPECTHLVRYVHQPLSHPLVGSTRGRILAFLFSCSPDHSQLGIGKELSSVLTVTSESPLERILDCLSTLRGFFESMSRQNIIQATFDLFFAAIHNVLQLSFSRFHEHELIVECVQCARVVFTVCTPLLDNKRIRLLLDFVVLVMGKSCESMQTVMTWRAAANEKDRIGLLTAIANLIVSVAQWNALDCFLPEDDVQPLASTTVATLVFLLDNMDAKTLLYPELEEVTFTALDMCADSFVSTFVNSSSSSSLHSATLYALSSERKNAQRVGIAVATKVSDYLESSHVADKKVLLDYLSAIMNSLITCKSPTLNYQIVSKAILCFAKRSSLASISGVFDSISSPYPSLRPFFESIYVSLESSIANTNCAAAQQEFEECLQTNFSLIKALNTL
ncbi:unnamed protein product [Phytomonas sp. EM1]|nr:unnamed protein product [Phytomonas sp. EM1]|eukprot:CCW59907.1 unnamed protein product [Phytomonas sp. isolate EM1]